MNEFSDVRLNEGDNSDSSHIEIFNPLIRSSLFNGYEKLLLNILAIKFVC